MARSISPYAHSSPIRAYTHAIEQPLRSFSKIFPSLTRKLVEPSSIPYIASNFSARESHTQQPLRFSSKIHPPIFPVTKQPILARTVEQIPEHGQLDQQHPNKINPLYEDLVYVLASFREEVMIGSGIFCTSDMLSPTGCSSSRGWRIGWACAPSNIASAIRNIHIKITDSAPAPFQEAALTALRSSPEYCKSLRTSYEARRDYAVEILSGLGFQIQFKPQGSFFLFAELPQSWLHSDVDFVRELIKKGGVAAVPGCGFFHNNSNSENKYYNRFVRFAFCKSDETLRDAAQRIRELQLIGDEGLLQKL